jgi:CHAT domain-containing protein/Tfp pilus assembly protein PilF
MTSRSSLLCLCLGSLTSLLLASPLRAQTAADLQERQAVVQRGITLFQQGKYKEAAKTLERAVELSIQVFGADDTRTLSTEGVLGVTYYLLNDYAKGELHYRRGMLGEEKIHGKISPEVAGCLCYLGFRFNEINDDATAEEYLVRGVKTWEALPEATRLGHESAKDYPGALGVLGTLCRKRGEYTKAEALLLRAQKFWDAGKAGDDVNALANLANLADLSTEMGEYARAETLMKRAVAGRARLGETAELAHALQNQAYMYMKMGQLPQAEPIFQRALKIYEARRGHDHPDTAHCLVEFGTLYRRLKKFDDADACYARALKIMEAKYGADSPELFFVLESMAVLEHYRKEYEKGLAIRQRTLKMVEAKFGAEHPHTALVLFNLAGDYHELGDVARSEAMLLRALKIREARLGADDPHIAEVLHGLALVQAGSGRWDEALASFDRMNRGNRRYIARVLPGLSEAQQLSFLQANLENAAGFHNAAVAVALMRARDPAVVARSAEWLLNSKAIAQQALAERGQQALANADPAQRKILRQLSAVRGQLASLTLTTPSPGQEAAHRKQLDRLAAEEQELAKRLGQAMGRPTREDPWVSLDEVRQALPADAVLIEVAELFLADFKDQKRTIRWTDPHFMAWVIPAAGQGEVKLVDLGTSEGVEKAVAAARKGLQDVPRSTARGEAAAEKELQAPLQALARLVVEPLLPHIGATKYWVLSPDTDLWLVPWAALPLKDGAYAAEKHTISYVISGRDLVTPPVKAPAKRDPPLMMADPDFDIEPKEAAAATAKLLGKPAPADGGLAAILDAPPNLRAASAIGRVARLPGTAAEAVAIKPKLQAYAGEEPWVYRGKNALEGIFKAWHSPRVMVLSTHGYFLAEDKSGKVPANPLLRCGLLLAGCNERAKASGTQEDGVLTGLEIVSSDLRGTELVVLSACETGLGDLKSGEGLAGLRQAFQLAGAQTVVASLWQVSDRDTALLMTDFFDGLAKGKSKADALREAQLARIKAHRDRDGAAHPFFWAAFTVTGH